MTHGRLAAACPRWLAAWRETQKAAVIDVILREALVVWRGSEIIMRRIIDCSEKRNRHILSARRRASLPIKKAERGKTH